MLKGWEVTFTATRNFGKERGGIRRNKDVDQQPTIRYSLRIVQMQLSHKTYWRGMSRGGGLQANGKKGARMESIGPCGVDIYLLDTPETSGVKRENESGQNDTVSQKYILEFKKRKN